MQRIYLSNFSFSPDFVITEKNLYHQMTRVLRTRKWDKMIFFDGKNDIDYVYIIEDINRSEVHFKYQEKILKDTELDFELVLYQSIPNKLEKCEYIVQKCSEIWFSKIIFFSADRTQRLSLSENKQQRLQKIMQEAIEQSGRNTLCFLDFQEKLQIENIEWINLVFHTLPGDNTKKLKDISPKKGQTVNIFVWPEWGFSPWEILDFQSQNFQKIFLWNRILRTETTGMVTGFFLSQK